MHLGVLSIFQNCGDARDDAEVMAGELTLARVADELGFGSYWATEHHFFGYSMCPDNLQWLAQVAGCTERRGSRPREIRRKKQVLEYA